MSIQANKLGGYELVREIARSNDIVYEAKDSRIGRKVALKELNMPTSLQGSQRRERIERFYREGRAAAMLQHPNIVTIYEVDEDSGRHYIAMEFLSGCSLGDKLKMSGPVPVDEAVKIAEAVLDGLAFAHRNGVVHRDVKPDNIHLLTDGQVKITDFGIARITADPSITADGQIFGTPSYMSPEQVKGQSVDHRSDIFSFGIVLYEMLTGQKPFTGDSVITITYNITAGEPLFSRQLPYHLEQVIRRALRKDPAQRYQSAEEMKAALHSQGQFPQGAPVQYQFPPLMNPSPQPMHQLPPHMQHGVPNTLTPMPQPMPQISPGAMLPDPMIFYKPRRSFWQSLKPETRAFFVTLLLAIVLAGLVVGAILLWISANESYKAQAAMGEAEQYSQDAQKKLDSGDYFGAIEKLTQAKQHVRGTPYEKQFARKISLVYIQMASHSRAEQRFAQAEREAQMAIGADPNFPDAYWRFGVDLLRRGDLESARQNLERAAVLLVSERQSSDSSLTPSELGSGYIQLGDAYRLGRQYTLAATMYDRAYSLAQGTDMADLAVQRYREVEPYIGR